eukprot:CAMPEP_0183421138 /NCGR_PEP_ID=MMETSP0370-20130417/26900_1 /TAXON_ID=268820 /ORGANISM="Peridinium aciculiferum, Strain PAER-2" /LENGTH=604 /DNA_ID=CAMNT_0025605093 /DNA_START=15 /DNA_END=1827 /DNA_ORIENTATION=+
MRILSKEGAYSQETRNIILEIEGITKLANDGTKILSDVHLGMYLGAKIGILGVNGAGKSTVMRILAGQDKDFMGNLNLDDGIKIGYLEQEPVIEEETVFECLNKALQNTRDMIKEFEDISMQMAEDGADMDSLMEKMDRMQEKLDACSAWQLDDFLDQAMEALRCPPRDAKIAVLSGGERRRVAICRLLLSNPDILLLDEPTNHLDAQSIAWLERFLADYKGTVVAITHDRYFLDNVAGWILELDQGKGLPFQGNYSQWLENKAKRLQGETKKKKSLEREINSELEFINMNKAGRQKKGKNRLRKYDDLVKEATNFNRESDFDSIVIRPGPPLRSDVLTLGKVSKGYDGRLLINEANLMIPAGAVVGIIGPNGAGKSTLFNMIMGKIQPDSGTITIGKDVVPMYVDQSREDLDPEATVFDELTGGQFSFDFGGKECSSYKYCSWFNFKSNKQSQKVGTLSGGERNRLQLGKTLRLGGNVLMLDEPSNDLDVNTLRALETAIQNWAGTTICISHDRWFLDRIATHIIAYEGNSELRFFEGGYSEYEQDLIERTGSANPTKVEYKPIPAGLLNMAYAGTDAEVVAWALRPRGRGATCMQARSARWW